MTSPASPRIAVVGSGPAAMGATLALLARFESARIFVVDYPPATSVQEPPPAANLLELRAFYDGIYAEIWRERPRAFPPPKTHFAAPIPKFPIQGGGGVFQSREPGGLSNYWGSTSLPFTARELARWPAEMAALDPSYRAVAAEIGISGRADGLNRYFAKDYVNRPPLEMLPVMEQLADAVNGASAGNGWSLAAGINRAALETRAGHPNACVACGECLAGCAQGSIYSTRQTWKRWVESGRVEFLHSPVTRILPESRTLELVGSGSAQTLTGLDAIFLAAGCPNSTALLLHSFGIREAVEMQDNAVFVFPMLKAFPLRPDGFADRHLSLNNLIIGSWRDESDHPYAQALVYPNFDYLWRYNTPPLVWPLARPLTQAARQRLLWSRLYLHGDDSQTYALRVDQSGAPHFETARTAKVGKAEEYIRQMRQAVRSAGFRIPHLAPIHQKTNSHYACTLPPGNKLVPVTPNGAVAPGVYVCDSTIFPSLPAVSLTMTIMGQAHRIASAAQI